MTTNKILHYQRCYLCKYCEEIKFYIDEIKIPIKTCYSCKKDKSNIHNPFDSYCEKFKLIN